MDDVDIWRAAKQVIELYPEDPDLAASTRADSAYEQGDMFNFALWTRITRAVQDLKRGRPRDGEAVN